MPSPFMGLISPAASPTAAHPGPWRRTALMGSLQARGRSR